VSFHKYVSDDEREELEFDYDLGFMREFGGDPLSTMPVTQCITRDLHEPPEFEPLGQAAGWNGQLVLSGIEPARKRPLWRPNPAMRVVHRRIVSRLEAFFEFHRPGRTHLSPNMHGANRYLYHVDLASAFNAVDGWRLATILFDSYNQSSGFAWGESVEDIYEMLQRYCLDSVYGGLVQGGPASPHLFHAYVERLLDIKFYCSDGISGTNIPYPVRELGRPSWSYRHRLAYSRFADDLVFSSPVPIGRRKRAYINQVIREAGFTVNTNKTRLYDLTRKPVIVSGVGIRLTTKGLRTYLPRPQLRRIEGLIHRATIDGEAKIDPSLVHGVMGWFFSVTDRRRMNRTEQRVVQAYKRYRTATATP
jgi:hypothetical protein